VATVNARIGWKALTASEYVSEGYTFLSTPNIKGNAIDFENVNYIDEFRFEESPELKLQKGDVLLVKDGNTLGITNIITGLQRPATVNGSIAVIRTKIMEARFLRYTLASSLVQDMILAVKAGMGVPHLFQADIKKFPLPRPPRPVQRAIANYLDRETARIDALIATKRRMMELLEERWQVVMRDAASGQFMSRSMARRATSVPWLTDVPAHWREGLLKLVATLGTGHTPSRSHPEWWVDLTIPWITTGEVAQMRSDRIEYVTDTRERISELGLAKSSATLHPAGTVVLCRTASAGYSAIMGTDMATSQDFATWTCGSLLRPRFLLLCLRAMRADLLGRLAMGSTHQTIYMPDIEAIKVPIPSVDEQDAIVSAVYSHQRSLDACSVDLAHQIELLQERRRAIITAAVTGQLHISEAA